MSRNYEFETDEGTWIFTDVEPVIEDTSFDHAFGTEKSRHCTGCEWVSVELARYDEESERQMEPEQFNGLVPSHVKETLLDAVAEDWQGGLYE